jgi:hypothetical protein
MADPPTKAEAPPKRKPDAASGSPRFTGEAGTHAPLGEHIPHEAWHVVEQKQGRVKPTARRESAAAVDDDAGLEREADRMGQSCVRR